MFACYLFTTSSLPIRYKFVWPWHVQGHKFTYKRKVQFNFARSTTMCLWYPFGSVYKKESGHTSPSLPMGNCRVWALHGGEDIEMNVTECITAAFSARSPRANKAKETLHHHGTPLDASTRPAASRYFTELSDFNMCTTEKSPIQFLHARLSCAISVYNKLLAFFPLPTDSLHFRLEITVRINSR